MGEKIAQTAPGTLPEPSRTGRIVNLHPVPYGFSYPDLPILARREDILKALKDHQALVVQGGTGSGKTTQLPKFLLDADMAATGLIGVTQPRRIAALSIADRLRQETGRPELIGSKIRFQEDLPKGTLVKVMTDGILLQEFRRDPLMRQYACIILDEAHERSLNVDILLGIFRRLLPRRPEFRLIVTSATLDADRFAKYLGGAFAPEPVRAEEEEDAPVANPAVASKPRAAKGVPAPAVAANPAPPALPGSPHYSVPVVEVEGRQFPVSLEYWDISGKEADETDEEDAPARAFPPVEAAAIAIRELQSRRPDNLLCFLPTEKEINELHRELERDLGRDFSILPLYSRLAPADQKKVFTEGGRPKIILATNIAETSLTIPGIGYVVDTGLARISRYHAQTKIQGLPIERISQASARQRAGRAGRVKPGTCVRLYSEADFNERIDFTEPEVLRSNLANVVLHLLALGLDVDTFPFPDPPAPAALKGAFRQLHELGAVDGQGSDARLTAEGLKLSRLPVDVAIGKILLKASDFDVLQPALIIAAGITVQDPRIIPREEPEKGKATGLHRRFEDPRSDFLGVLAMWVWIHRNWGDRFTQRKLRALCVENFISYNRVREWMDLTDQFCRLLKVTLDPAQIKFDEGKSDSLHKAILAGFLPFLGRKKPEDVSYRLAGDKEAFIHPGSALAKRKPEWIVAGEVRQTSRVYIYRAAEIKPAWVEEIAGDACKRTYASIAWNPERGFVEALERVTYKGFAIRQDRRVNYESVAPEECAEIFWREGVLRDGAGAPFPFRDANQKVLESLASLESKARVRGLVPDEETQAHWYQSRAPGVASRIGLQRFLKDAGGDGVGGSPAAGAQVLTFTMRDWAAALEGGDWEVWAAGGAVGSEAKAVPDTRGAAPGAHVIHRLFPDRLRCGPATYRLGYRFDFGDPLDGISIETDPEGLAALNVNALFQGIPGWRKWIWEFCLERLGAKASQAARPLAAELAAAWESLVEKPSPPAAPAIMAPAETMPTGASPAVALALALAARSETASQPLSLPTVWPAHLQIHIFVRGTTGRRFLLHLDPACGGAEAFAASRRLLCGEASAARPWGEWSAAVTSDLGCVPPALSWRGLAYGADPLGLTALSGASPGACGWFADIREADFHRALAEARLGLSAKPGAARILAGAETAPPPMPKDPKFRASLVSFFAKRLQVLLDAWSCPDRMRKETSALRELLAQTIMPALYLAEYGADALIRAEKELPPPRPPALAKPGTQVKSLASLGQAVTRGGESPAWSLAALCLGAATLSRAAFAEWFRFLAQPPLDSKSAIADLIAKVSAYPEWEEMLLSPYHAAWASRVLEDRLPVDLHKGSGGAGFSPDPAKTGKAVRAAQSENVPAALFPGGEAELLSAWKDSRASADRIRRGAKALRDRFCARLTGFGQSVAGLPKDMRAALDALDKPLPWTAKAEAELELELYLNKMTGKAGAAVEAKAKAKADPADQQREVKRIQDLSGRFKKL
jgi:HrpA-like RNA helicase